MHGACKASQSRKMVLFGIAKYKLDRESPVKIS